MRERPQVTGDICQTVLPVSNAACWELSLSESLSNAYDSSSESTVASLLNSILIFLPCLAILGVFLVFLSRLLAHQLDLSISFNNLLRQLVSQGPYLVLYV